MGCFYMARICSIYVLDTQRRLKFKVRKESCFVNKLPFNKKKNTRRYRMGFKLPNSEETRSYSILYQRGLYLSKIWVKSTGPFNYKKEIMVYIISYMLHQAIHRRVLDILYQNKQEFTKLLHNLPTPSSPVGEKPRHEEWKYGFPLGG